MRKTTRRAAVAALVLVAVALPVSAVPGGMNGYYGSSSMSGDWAMVRIIHASPDAPAVDVWIDGERAIRNLEFGESTRYSRLMAGDHVVQVVPAGETTPVVLAAEVTLEKGVSYSIAAIGTLAMLEPLVTEDGGMFSKAYVRFVHASPDAPNVDVAPAGGDPLFANASFGDTTDYVALPAGTYDLDARLAGTDTVALSVPDVMRRGGVAYTAIAIGSAADGTLSVMLLKDTHRR